MNVGIGNWNRRNLSTVPERACSRAVYIVRVRAADFARGWHVVEYGADGEGEEMAKNLPRRRLHGKTVARGSRTQAASEQVARRFTGNRKDDDGAHEVSVFFAANCRVRPVGPEHSADHLFVSAAWSSFPINNLILVCLIMLDRTGH